MVFNSPGAYTHHRYNTQNRISVILVSVMDFTGVPNDNDINVGAFLISFQSSSLYIYACMYARTHINQLPGQKQFQEIVHLV